MPAFTEVRQVHTNDVIGTATTVANYIGTSSLANNDTIGPIPIGNGQKVTDVVLIHKGADTNATAALVFDVGTASDPDALIDGSAAGASGALVRSEINVLGLDSLGEATIGAGLQFDRADSLTGGPGGEIYVKVVNAANSAGTAPQVQCIVTTTKSSS